MAKKNILSGIDTSSLTEEDLKQLTNIIAMQKRKKNLDLHFKKMEKQCPGYKKFLKEYTELTTPHEFVATVPVKVIFEAAWESGMDYDVVSADFYGGWEYEFLDQKKQPASIRKIRVEKEKQINKFCDKIEAAVKSADNNLTKHGIEDRINDILFQMSVDMKKEPRWLNLKRKK
jgi:hypothetical protein